MNAQNLRPSPIVGRWYPKQPDQLSASVGKFIEQAEVDPVNGRIIGLLSPHAGHRFSGPVAGHAFKLVRNMDIDIVALIGPSHHPYESAVITSGHDAYVTPLGHVPIDHQMLETLQQTVPLEAVQNDQEHALEIILPFLQYTLGSFSLIPLALLDQSLQMAQKLGTALAGVLAEKRALLVASSDLSHFYPQPTANALDTAMLDAVASFDPARVIQVEESGKGFACGRGAIATVMIAAGLLGANRARIVNYGTSGDITQDYRQVVGYGSAVFFQAASDTN